jgi:hypothetical protein
MSFFPPPPERPADTRDPNRPTQPRWMQPPKDEIPARVPLSALLARTGDVAFVMPDIEVYSDGCYFRLQWTLRRGARTDAEWQRTQSAFLEHRGFLMTESETGLRFGVQFSDGTRVIHTPGYLLDEDATAPVNTLWFQTSGGSGDDDRSVQRGGLWLWPLPPPGPLSVVFEWGAFGIPQTDFEVDATALLATSKNVRPLWD